MKVKDGWKVLGFRAPVALHDAVAAFRRGHGQGADKSGCLQALVELALRQLGYDTTFSYVALRVEDEVKAEQARQQDATGPAKPKGKKVNSTPKKIKKVKAGDA